MSEEETYLEGMSKKYVGRVLTGMTWFETDHDGFAAKSVRLDFHDGESFEIDVDSYGFLDPVQLKNLK